MLGDAVGSGGIPPSGPIRVGVTTQLAAFTIEGVIRAAVRLAHRGICHPPSVVWHAYCRWGVLQGVGVHEAHRHWAEGRERWPDGWLAAVPQLRERRGSAPATVAALRQPQQPTADRPVTSSRGCHALTRSLPLAALAEGTPADRLADLARDVAALTHGDPQAHRATAAAVLLLGRCLAVGSFDEAVASQPHLPDLAEFDARIREAFDEARLSPMRPDRLAHLAPDATAPSALLGGVYVTASNRLSRASAVTSREAMDALTFAATAPDGDSVAAVTGALLGALHGVDIWPVELLSRLELVWVMDTLARDLVLQLTESPGGGEYEPPKDPYWWDRYPGW
jgi:ADP-ribosylglycohydrolase